MIQMQTLLTFIIYFIFLMGVGIYFYRKTVDVEDYLLGGRGMGSWVTALSAQASDMSGWLLMGLPGAVYIGGMNQAWIAIGLFIGTCLNWKFVAPRLRVYTKRTESMTLASFFEDRFKDPTGLLRVISALITLLFFTIYSSSGLVAAGKLFESMFNIDYTLAVIIGSFVIVLYTFLGGFLAVCWTDLFQGLLMFVAIIVVPILAYNYVGGAEAIKEAMLAKEVSTSLISKDFSIMATISTMAWGLGYFGQPHILARFMSIKSVKKVPEAMKIAVTWVFISLGGAVIVGVISIPMFDSLASGNHEKVFIYMISRLFNPWIGGILLAAILSAIMSTIDSQLLVSSSTLTEDFYKRVINKEASDKELMHTGRICVLLISIIALFLALNPNNTVLGLVAYAWAGFGAAFGPVVLFALFSKNTSWQSALAGMVVGTVVLLIWKQVGLGKIMYEIVPGFIANVATILIVNTMVKQTDEDILNDFDEVIEVTDTIA
ncbi:sodium/proline symporter PutP [Selenihalanaerobacter shriftii]|uniref:Sodium/proline symporter n=1 Tax=Selenihalanaerobacter shriftii TaxID=142842 RepID=A0A1T4JMR0_9FIRM|nr:sodium/proline symporter PutP [Selenihalanaerobacter shriftii]SJZ31421.1 sodium/proline symporter [Selenihalanaerobacter shriftii]